jgi:hypothetical protein
MTNPTPVNMVASVKARLKNVMKERGIAFRFVLIRYATERFLYRLSTSPYANQFVLKGGNLFIIWQNGCDYRPTIDSDMLCFGEATPEHLLKVFTEACKVDSIAIDGISFDPASITLSDIRKDTEYGGTRIMLMAHLGPSRIQLQFDIGIGDAITPTPEWIDFPVLLNGAVPHLKAYPMATAIAEKTEAMFSNGLNNSRLKDFYDTWLLSERFDHSYETLRLAIQNTFAQRQIQISEKLPRFLSPEFATNPMKMVQWAGFLRKNKTISPPTDFGIICARISAFLTPVLYPPTTPPKTWKAATGWQ